MVQISSAQLPAAAQQRIVDGQESDIDGHEEALKHIDEVTQLVLESTIEHGEQLCRITVSRSAFPSCVERTFLHGRTLRSLITIIDWESIPAFFLRNPAR